MRINPDAAFGATMAAMAIMSAAGKEPPEWMKIVSFGSSLFALGYNIARLQEDEAEYTEMAGLGCPPTCPCDPCTKDRYIANRRYNWYR